MSDRKTLSAVFLTISFIVVMIAVFQQLVDFLTGTWYPPDLIFMSVHTIGISFILFACARIYVQLYPLPKPPLPSIDISDFRDALIREVGDMPAASFDAEGALPNFRRYRVSARVRRDYSRGGLATWWFDRLPQAVRFYFKMRRDWEYSEVEIALETREGVYVIPIHDG